MNRLRLLALISLWASPVFADVLLLKDGTKLSGDVKKSEGGYTVIDATGKSTKVAIGNVKSITVTPAGGADVAMSRLISLRRATESLSDLVQIIDRYNAFLKQNPMTAAADEARKDLAVWEDRAARKMLKAGEVWVTSDQLGKAQEASLEIAIEASKLVRAGRLKEAALVLDRALAQDPANAAALYLRGLVLYRQEQLPQARKAFDAAIDAAKEHGPTLNNLAVVLWRQNQFVAAMSAYDQAMVAMPIHKTVLDNVAEALNALPEKYRDNAVTKKAVRHFNEQDAELQDLEKKDGSYRWGSAWVNESELEKLQAAEKKIKDELADLEQEFGDAAREIELKDKEIEETLRSIRRIEACSYTRDANGRMTRLPYPRIYYDLQRDLGNLNNQREALKFDQDKMRKQAKEIQQKLPAPRYTGVQRMIDVDGAPQLASAPAAPAGSKAAGGGIAVDDDDQFQTPRDADASPRNAPKPPGKAAPSPAPPPIPRIQ